MVNVIFSWSAAVPPLAGAGAQAANIQAVSIRQAPRQIQRQAFCDRSMEPLLDGSLIHEKVLLNSIRSTAQESGGYYKK